MNLSAYLHNVSFIRQVVLGIEKFRETHTANALYENVLPIQVAEMN